MKSRDVNDTLREHGTEGLRQALDKAPRQGGESSGDGRRQQHERNTRDSYEALILPSPKQPFEVAKVFLGAFATHDDGLLKLRFWRGDWWAWKGSHWRRVDARAVRRVLYRFLDRAVYPLGNSFAKWDPTRHKIFDVLDAMEAIALLDRDIEQPVWLDADDPDSIDERKTDSFVACQNGLYNVTSGVLLPHSPRYFNLVAVPFAYDPQAPVPQRWLSFLRSLWPMPDHPVPEIDVLSEWFGYVISGRRDLHKMFLMVGPTRGGKGVIARSLEALIGKANTVAPTLASLSGEFGMAPLIGKPLAIIADARLSTRTGTSVVVERLLSISGGDMLTINIKYQEQWSGHLPTALHIVSNELPRFSDASSAIVGRFIIVVTQHSWLGREDLTLEADLARELPGIFNWALGGLGGLAANGWRFTHNPNADAALVEMHDLASPTRAFVRECCELDPDKRVPRDLLYGSYKVWATNNGHPVASNAVFGRDLHAAFPMVRDEQPRDESGGRYRAYRGITLRPHDQDESVP